MGQRLVVVGLGQLTASRPGWARRAVSFWRSVGQGAGGCRIDRLGHKGWPCARVAPADAAAKAVPVSREVQLPTQDSLTIRTIAILADTIPAGDMCGGWLMSQMDLASRNVAALDSGGRSATVAVDGVIVYRPNRVGDEVALFARLVKEGRTSIIF